MVSFIIPTRNEGKYIEKCIESIYNSCLPARSVPTKAGAAAKNHIFEIIVIDDGSTDNTPDIIKKYPDIRFFRLLQNKGSAYARNLGAINASGNLLFFVDADVWLDNKCVSEFLNQIKNYDIVHTVPFFTNGIPIFPLFAAKDYPVITATFMIKKDSIDKLDKYFDERYVFYNEDLDFFLRCKIIGLTAKYLETVNCSHWIKEPRAPEFRYYMDLRNSIYAYLKFYKLKKSVVNFPSLKVIRNNIVNFLWNKNVYSTIYFDRIYEKNLFLRLWYKFSPRAKITNKTRIYILFLICKAFLWNLSKLPEIKKEHNNLVRFLKKSKIMYDFS